MPWDDLKETGIGIFSGLTWAEIESAHPEIARRFLAGSDWDAVDGAEGLGQRRARGRRVIEAVIERHGDQDVVVLFTHGGILQHMVAALLDTERVWGASVENTALFEFVFDRDRWAQLDWGRHNPRMWRIARFNDASHLGVSGGLFPILTINQTPAGDLDRLLRRTNLNVSAAILAVLSANGIIAVLIHSFALIQPKPQSECENDNILSYSGSSNAGHTESVPDVRHARRSLR